MDPITPITLTVNGKQYQVSVSPGTRLVDVLRDHLGLTGTKIGCGIGECGSCTVLLEGKPVRSCRITVAGAAGKEVRTIEGLADGEKLHSLQQAFIDTNAVQCGFCTPGILMELHALLERNPSPSKEDIIVTLSRHLCRCTGYVPMIEAVQKAAGKIFSSGKEEGHGVGASAPRADALAKVTGDALYTADISRPGQLFGKIVRSTVAHGSVKRISGDRAKQMPGVVRIVTQADIPGEKNYGKALRDQPVLAHSRVRFIGDPVALVLAETLKQAEAAAGAIRIEYDLHPAVYTAEDALKDSAPLLHDQGNIAAEYGFELGQPDQALKECEIVLDEVYVTPPVEHACLEPEAAIAYHDEGGLLTVVAPTQNVFFDRREIAAALGLKREEVRVLQPFVGGSFGKREDLYAQILCALGAQLTKRPVKIVFSREETFQVTTKRHPFRMRYRTGARGDGKILVQDIAILADTGAYASWAPNIMKKAAVHACGPYLVPNVRVRARAVYTNNPPSGAMRGFGAPQVAFACESQMDVLAVQAGIDPVALRRLNLLRNGQFTAAGQELPKCAGLSRTLETAAELAEKEPLKKQPGEKRRDQARYSARRGRGFATVLYGIGYGHGIPDIGSVSVELTPAGTIEVEAGAVECGQGISTVLGQIVVTELGIDPERVTVIRPDTVTSPDSGSTVASRQTYVTGNAARQACRKLRETIIRTLGEFWKCSGDNIALGTEGAVLAGKSRKISWEEIAAHILRMNLKHQARFRVITDPVESGKGGRPYAAYAFATQVADVEVHPDTGEVKVLRIIAVHDLGKAVNPALARGQIYGGVAMGLGFALREDLRLAEGVVKTSNFDSYRIPTAAEMPEIMPVLIEEAEETGPYGAKGIGEPPILATAPAIANAFCAATGIRVTALPLSADRIKSRLAELNTVPRGAR